MDKRRAGLIDPAVENDINLGDHIISQAVRHILLGQCGFDEIVPVPSIWRLKRKHYRDLNGCDVIIVGGTNLLSSNMNVYNQWKINLLDVFRLKRVVLLGVGWWQYQRRPNRYTRILLRRILDRRYLHSVRDSFTVRQLGSIGIHNVVNTTCPTLWGLAPEIQQRIPTQKAAHVIFAVTCYNMAPEIDKRILDLLFDRYQEVYLWPQGNDDRRYAGTLSDRLQYIDGGLDDFDRFLAGHDDVDYVGTRLHAGARVLQKGKRALVLSLDNRAKEIGQDTNLDVIDRADVAGVDAWITGSKPVRVCLPTEEIDRWVTQFRDDVSSPRIRRGRL